METYDKWPIVCEDSELDVRIDPQEPDGYGMNIKGSENYLLFPRGTLKEIALTDRDRGKKILENLMPYTLLGEDIFNSNGLNYDSLIAVATKAYWIEEERYRKSVEEYKKYNELKLEKL
jgi:hypothetical protein